MKTRISTLLIACLMLLGGTSVAYGQQHQGQRHGVQPDSARGGMKGMMHGSAMQGGMMHNAGMTGMMGGARMQGSMMQNGGMMGMMHGMHGMMSQMMQDPIRRAAMLVHALPAMNDALDLTDAQAEQLAKRRDAFVAAQQDAQQQMEGTAEALQEALGAAQPDANRVRDLLRQKAQHQADAQALTFQTAAEMRALLTDAQRGTLDGMAPMHVQHLMMQNLSMMEMMQAMHGASPGGCPMQGAMDGSDTMPHGGMMREGSSGSGMVP